MQPQKLAVHMGLRNLVGEVLGGWGFCFDVWLSWSLLRPPSMKATRLDKSLQKWGLRWDYKSRQVTYQRKK